jgi:hypothetical protein
VAESNTVSMFERLARDPSVSVEKLERLMDLQDRANKRNAEAAFNAALAAMQADLPTVRERGGIKNRDGNIQSKYALWEDINAAILPLLKEHGFSLTFRQEQKENGICVTGVLSHREGHSERTSITLPADQSGGKNAVQAVGSSVSYGKRYTAGMLLNLTSADIEADDDADSAAPSPAGPITPAGGAWDSMDADQKRGLLSIAETSVGLMIQDKYEEAFTFIEDQKLTNDEKVALWTRFNSGERSSLKKAAEKIKKSKETK